MKHSIFIIFIALNCSVLKANNQYDSPDLESKIISAQHEASYCRYSNYEDVARALDFLNQQKTLTPMYLEYAWWLSTCPKCRKLILKYYFQLSGDKQDVNYFIEQSKRFCKEEQKQRLVELPERPVP